MKILIVGATGPTGQALVHRALVHGHEVTAFAHDPEALTPSDASLRTVKGDVLDPASLASAMPGHDAVILAVGPDGRGPTTLRTDAVNSTIRAMGQTGVRRLITLSGHGAGVTRKSRGVWFDWVLAPTVFRHTLKDQNGLEAALRKSDLDWVVVRPSEMTDDPPKRKWVVSFDGFGITDKVSREDVAQFMIDQLQSDEYVRKPVSLGYDVPLLA